MDCFLGSTLCSSVLDESLYEIALDDVGCAQLKAKSGALKVGSDTADQVSEGSLIFGVTSFWSLTWSASVRPAPLAATKLLRMRGVSNHLCSKKTLRIVLFKFGDSERSLHKVLFNFWRLEKAFAQCSLYFWWLENSLFVKFSLLLVRCHRLRAQALSVQYSCLFPAF